MRFGHHPLEPGDAAFAAEVCAFLTEHVTAEVLEAEARTGDGIAVDVHLALGARGWLAPTWPTEEGGIGASPVQAAILERELVAHDVPLIAYGTTMNAEPVIRHWSSEPVRSTLLRGIASGEVRICLGYTEPDAGSDLAGISTRAVRDGDDWIVTGQKIFSTAAHLCQHAFLIARSNVEVPKHKGLTMLLVDLSLPGVQIQPIRTLGGERTNLVFYDGVRVPDTHRLGPVDGGWSVVNGPLLAEHGRASGAALGLEDVAAPGAVFARALDRALQLAVRWAEASGPDGRRPADDPLVRRRLAEVALDVEVTRCTPGPMGKVAGAELLIRDAADLLALVGLEALVEDPHGARTLEWVHRYAQGTAIHGGTTEIGNYFWKARPVRQRVAGSAASRRSA